MKVSQLQIQKDLYDSRLAKLRVSDTKFYKLCLDDEG